MSKASNKQFTKAVEIVKKHAEHNFRLRVVFTSELDHFFKGNLDGLSIWIDEGLTDEDKLFNLLHMIGHSVQWNTDYRLRILGSTLYKNPSEELIRKLQLYEWEANCYALQVLYELSIRELNKWLERRYRLDMLCLTHYYRTGEKVTERSAMSAGLSYFYRHQLPGKLERKEFPFFVPVASEVPRDGLVIGF